MRGRELASAPDQRPGEMGSVYARRETKPARVAMTPIRMGDDVPPELLLVIEDLTEEERRPIEQRLAHEAAHPEDGI